jgi:RNA polymerase sigma-70 factor (ECF subfamily)
VESERLFVAAQGGDVEARAALVNLFRPYLMHIAEARMRSWLRAKEGASDVVQQTVIEAQRDFSASEATNLAELRLWLRGILLHNLADMKRKYAGTSMRNVQRERTLGDRESRESLLRAAVDQSEPPSRAMSDADEREAVWQAMNAIRPEYREAIKLHFFDGLTFDEIGHLIDRSRGAAERLVKRAVNKFGAEYRRLNHDNE